MKKIILIFGFFRFKKFLMVSNRILLPDDKYHRKEYYIHYNIKLMKILVLDFLDVNIFNSIKWNFYYEIIIIIEKNIIHYKIKLIKKKDVLVLFFLNS